MSHCVQSKPNPVGLKNFVLAASDSLVLDFPIYIGKRTVSEADVEELDLGGGVVKGLVKTTNRDEPTFLLTDKYFPGVKLTGFLIDNKNFLTGTIMANRTNGEAARIPNDRSMKRGESHCRVRSDDKLCQVKWKDNKSVLLLSTAFGTAPEGTCRRCSKDEKKRAEVTQPHIVARYNQHMGGVDLIDRYVAYYRITVRSKKWTVLVFTQFLDMACCNSWIEYQRDCDNAMVLKKDRLDLLHFKAVIAYVLVQAESSISRGSREDAQSGEEPTANKRIKVIPLRPNEVKCDIKPLGLSSR
ncbi:piggyBac transposable element-derived protein 1-like [Ixodes scapularis]|uniref:piggyBac transposable element-derived protein 1-like n=1 Tax=Ixodes scapularis TaxID=6945 RepID=UPI001A9DC458|nr:piggyBac transposable element-derived protein 1-like [Ixodes scapularis]XP_040075590.1 piggyBac transposable element-derived protein 1-like [Ixodes scapularis]